MAGRPQKASQHRCRWRQGAHYERRSVSLDIDRSAWLLIKRHGADAVFEAAKRADQLQADGDIEGAAVWQRIDNAIDRLQMAPPNL
jgi:hypothetical protein